MIKPLHPITWAIFGANFMIWAFIFNYFVSEGSGIAFSLVSGVCFLLALIRWWEDMNNGE